MVIFKPIPNHIFYFAGSDGQIYSNRPRGWEKSSKGLRALKPGIQSNGKYYYVNLQNDQGVYKTQRVHRLVCLAFHGNPVNDTDTTSHLDGHWENNIPDNLKWESLSNNMERKKEHKTDDIGFKNSRASLNHDQLLKIRGLLKDGKLTHKEIGDMFDVSRLTITKIANGYRYKGQ
jgi:hypothetical protein